MKLGTETGSLVNHVYTSRRQVEPVVGMGATVCGWSDRSACTIVKVTATQIHVRADISTRVDTNGMSESQSYEYSPDPLAGVSIFRRTKRGYRNNCGESLLIGQRDTYHDYSF